jgi:hypothetical protein
MRPPGAVTSPVHPSAHQTSAISKDLTVFQKKGKQEKEKKGAPVYYHRFSTALLSRLSVIDVQLQSA